MFYIIEYDQPNVNRFKIGVAMNGSAYRNSKPNFPRKWIRPSRGFAFGVIILVALAAFEIFNFSTTEYALADLLGNLTFLGISWATILAIAFCGIDFAGIARLHTPEAGNGQANETWYLFGAWLLAATMNAMLTWWGVSLALVNHDSLGNNVVDRSTLIRVVPIFVAVLVWLIRVLIIGTYSTAGVRLLTQRDYRRTNSSAQPEITASTPSRSLNNTPVNVKGGMVSSRTFNTAAHSMQTNETKNVRPEPEYVQPVSASPRSSPYAKSAPINARENSSTPADQGTSIKRSF
jgi:hypothetical protein